LLLPVTVAENCCVSEAIRRAVVGVIEIETETDERGWRVTLALSLLVGSAALVAVIVTDCAAVILAGAV
jgi:hypothetical protein